MKTMITMLLALCMTAASYGQDLRLDIYKASKTVTSSPDANCIPQKDTLIRLEMDVVNFGDADVVFPASQITYDLCREQNVVKDLFTIQVYDKCGTLIHSHNDGSKVWDYAVTNYWKNPDVGCADLGTYSGSKYPSPSETDFGISNGCWYRTNSFPSGYQLGVSLANFPAVADTYFIKVFLNIGYLNQADCNSDTATRWVIVDKANNGFTDNVSAPEKCGIFLRESAPCTDISPLTTGTVNPKTRTITVDGSPCTTKYVARYINFGAGQILADDGFQKQWIFTFTGNEWVDNTALNQKDLEAYAASYPGVTKKGKPSYQYKIYDAITVYPQNAIIIRNVRY